MRPVGDYRSLLASPSGRLTIIVVQHATQPLAAPNRSTATDARLIFHDQSVAQPLMVALAMIMLNKFVDRPP